MTAKKKKTKGISENLLIQEENGWKNLSKSESVKLERYCEEYKTFLSSAKTERLCHDIGLEMAKKKGYKDLKELIAKGATLKPGDKIYSSAAGKTLTLIHIGKRSLSEGLRIVGGHTDSPRIDLKPRPLYEDAGLAMFDTHYYGGIKKYQWVTIPLALHGVIIKKDGTKVSICIGEDPADPVFNITDLLPHLGKDQASKPLNDAFNADDHLNVLVGSKPLDSDESEPVKLNVIKALNDRYGIDEGDLVSAELELVPAGPARDVGFDRSLILGYGHDDRICAYAGMKALLDLKQTPEYTAAAVMCDKEEIGSVGSTGMQSFIFENTMAEVINLSKDTYSDLILRRCLKNSCMISADVNALHDPNYSSVSSPNNNMARLNMGAVLTKYTGARGKSGTNDASAEYMAQIRDTFDKANVTWQAAELGKVDQGGGGTIAYMLARYEMNVVDCGVGIFSMHAPYELAGKFDTYMTYKAYHAFFKS